MERLNIFLLFPELDEEILSLGENKDLYEDIPKQLTLIRKLIKNTDYQFFYDANNVSAFCKKALLLTSGEHYLGKLNTQILAMLDKRATMVVNVSLPDYAHGCYQWDSGSASVESRNNHLFEYATEKFIEREGENTIIISLLYEDPWERGIMPMLKDAPNSPELPLLLRIPYFSPINTFIEWYRSKESNRTFSLHDMNRFERTTYIRKESKQRIYLEKGSSHYWYYDYYHKDNKEHYEVFDSCGNHIGEADMNGNLDESKRDNKKSIKGLFQ